MKCIICNSNMKFFFSKNYKKTEYSDLMKDIGVIEYFKCTHCGLVMSKTHSMLEDKIWNKLNYDFHHYHENNITNINQPPYLEQATMLNILSENKIIILNNMLDYAGGYGTLSKVLDKYYSINLPVYDPYVNDTNFKSYVEKENLKKYDTVINSALFEHLLNREAFDHINTLVEDNGAMIIHTVICEKIPNNPDWFYLAPPVHTTFHTNSSMNILMKQWGYKASIYCPTAKSWILLKKSKKCIKQSVMEINSELQTEYLIYEDTFVDYWKGF